MSIEYFSRKRADVQSVRQRWNCFPVYRAGDTLVKRFTMWFTMLLLSIGLGNVVQADSCSDLTQGLVACYTFNGNANDGSGNNNHGIVIGAILTTDRLGNPNSAYKFDGGDYIQVPNSSSINIAGNITVSAWIRSSSTPQHTGLFHKETLEGSSRVTGWQASINSYAGNNWSIAIRNNWPSVTATSQSSTKVVDGNWHHLVGIYDGQTVTIYTDGIKDNSVPYTKGMLTNDRPLYIGVDPDRWGGRDFRGDLDDVRIYNRALSETEVQQLAGLNVTSTDNSVIISNWEYKMTMTPNSDPNAIEIPMQVTSKADGSYEGNDGKVTIAVSPQSNPLLTEGDLCMEVGAALTTDGQPSIICATAKANGDVVLSDPQNDTLEPLTVNKDGEMVLTDGSTRVTIDAEGGFVGTDADNPQHQVIMTPDGQVTVIDNTTPDIAVTMNSDGSLTGKDTLSGTEVTIDRQGQQVVTHPDFPGMQATVNEDGTLTVTDALDPDAAGVAVIVDAKTRSYQVINLANGTCYHENSNLRKSFFKKIAGFVSDAAGLVAKVATKIAPIAKVIGEVAGTVNKVVSFILGKAPQINQWASKIFKACQTICPLFLTNIAGFVAAVTTPASAFLGFLGTAQTVAKVVSVVANAVPKIAIIAQKVSNWFRKWRSARQLRESDRPWIAECEIITLATLSDFSATPVGQSIRLQWETAAELNSMGFDVWRAKAPADGQCRNKRVEDYQEITKLTDRLIPAEGSLSQGASYGFEDKQVIPKITYCYGLEEISNDGSSFIHWDWIATAVAR